MSHNGAFWRQRNRPSPPGDKILAVRSRTSATFTGNGVDPTESCMQRKATRSCPAGRFDLTRAILSKAQRPPVLQSNTMAPVSQRARGDGIVEMAVELVLCPGDLPLRVTSNTLSIHYRRYGKNTQCKTRWSKCAQSHRSTLLNISSLSSEATEAHSP